MESNTDAFFQALIKGDKATCMSIANAYFEQKGGDLIPVYEDIIKEALYEVGRYWEFNKISVATEHLASAIASSVLNHLFSKVAVDAPENKSIVLTCIEGEGHEIGIKMVNDFFETHQWNCYYLGADTPLKELLAFLESASPHILAVSLSIYFNFSKLKKTIDEVRAVYPELTILVGGQAFDHIEGDAFDNDSNTHYIKNLIELETFYKTV